MKFARVCGHDLWVSDYIAGWDAVAEDSPWEKARIDSILETTKPGECLFDIGTEHAWMSAIFAKHVGGENMVLAEPGPAFWPTIRQTWERNELELPLGCWPGFVGAESTWAGQFLQHAWPRLAEGEETHDPQPYKHPNHHAEIPTLTIDDLVALTRPPDAITIDVEGAELEVLRGARETLSTHRPKLWISLHPDLLERDFGATVEDFYAFLHRFRYGTVVLGVDHETHVLAMPR